MILGEALVGIPDCSDYTVLYILLAADIIDDLTRHRIHEHGVDGEVAAAHIPMCAGEFDMRRPTAIFIATLGTKCGNFVTVAFLNYKHDAKTYTYRHCMRKERTDLLRPR
jgi:hypothetical protein